MQNASLKTIPSNRSMAGFKMCVLGAPPRGMDIFWLETWRAILSWAPANDRRMPSSPAISGRRGKLNGKIEILGGTEGAHRRQQGYSLVAPDVVITLGARPPQMTITA